MNAPRVGIIIPCFNQGRFAGECVASVRAQTHANWTAVVVDDASTDDSLALLQPLAGDGVTVVHLEKNLGRALVRNEAVRRLGDVDYVLNLDCDDRLTPNYVAQLVAALTANERAGLAYGVLEFFGANTPATRWPEQPFVYERRYLENVIPGPGVLFRAGALASTRGWRAEFTESSGEDWDIWLQVVENGWEAEWVCEAIYQYRQHSSSFLAARHELTESNVLLNLLRTHAPAIRRSCGFEAFLAPRVIPALLDSIRHLRVRRAATMARTLLRHAPAATLALVVRHYARRLRAMLTR